MKRIDKEKYKFDPDQAYRLTGVTNANGSKKTERLDFYNKYLGCIVTFINYDEFAYDDGRFRLWLYFKRDPKGKHIHRNIHTSLVNYVEETEFGLNIHTENSTYVLEKTVLEQEIVLDAADLIELYLSMDDNYYFCKGFYYNSEKKAYELYTYIHVSFTVDSCLIGTNEGIQWGNFVCRYYLSGDRITFYNTLYHQQDYSIPMLIHNNGTSDLIICFEGFSETWTIRPGEAKRIIPYNPAGADEKQQQEIGI